MACGAHVRPFSDSRVTVEAAPQFTGKQYRKHHQGFPVSDRVIGRDTHFIERDDAQKVVRTRGQVMTWTAVRRNPD